MAKKTPYTSMTQEFLKDSGWSVRQKVEYWNPFAKPHGRRVDLFGVIDIVCIMPGEPVLHLVGGRQRGRLLGVQSTSGGCHSARRKKILASEQAREWVLTGNELWLISWKKKQNRWVPRVEVFGPSDFGFELIAA